MVSLLKLQDWNSCTSFRWSPGFHMSCNHWGTCRRPPFFGSHSLRNRAFKACCPLLAGTCRNIPCGIPSMFEDQIRHPKSNMFGCIQICYYYASNFFYHWEKMKVIGKYQKQHAHDCWTDQVSVLAFLADSMKSSSSASFTGESSIEVGTTVGPPQQWASFGHLQWVGHLPQGASLPHCHQSGHLQAAHALWLLPCDGEDWRNLGLETSTSIVSN